MFPNALVASRSLAVLGLPADAVIVSSQSYFFITSNIFKCFTILLFTALIHVMNFMLAFKLSSFQVRPDFLLSIPRDKLLRCNNVTPAVHVASINVFSMVMIKQVNSVHWTHILSQKDNTGPDLKVEQTGRRGVVCWRKLGTWTLDKQPQGTLGPPCVDWADHCGLD